MNDKYISLLLEYSMCFTLCGYQVDVIQTFQELHPALAAPDYIYYTQPHAHCPCN